MTDPFLSDFLAPGVDADEVPELAALASARPLLDASILARLESNWPGRTDEQRSDDPGANSHFRPPARNGPPRVG